MVVRIEKMIAHNILHDPRQTKVPTSSPGRSPLALQRQRKAPWDEVAKVLPHLTRPQSALSLREPLLLYQRESAQSRGARGVTGKRKGNSPNTDDRKRVSLISTVTPAPVSRLVLSHQGSTDGRYERQTLPSSLFQDPRYSLLVQCSGAVKSDAKNTRWLGREGGSYFHVAHSYPWLALAASYTEFSLTWTATLCTLAWGNSRHFRDAILVSPWSQVWETTAEISYWWRINTQIWVVLPIG